MRSIAFILLLSYCFCCAAQSNYIPPRYTFEGIEYFVYPVRGHNLEAIPPTGFNLPDGSYIIFENYSFKKDKRKKKMVLRDTTHVSALCEIKNNLPNGKATFFHYGHRSFLWWTPGGLKTKWMRRSSGHYENGLEEGQWTQESGGEWSVMNYHKGLLHGKSIDHMGGDSVCSVYREDKLHGPRLVYHKGRIQTSEKYKEGIRCDTVIEYYDNGRIRLTYDILEKEKPFASSDDLYDYYFRNHVKDYWEFHFPMEKIRSFYREYYESGKVKNQITFTNGMYARFDSLILNPGKVTLAIKSLPAENGKERYRVASYRNHGKYSETEYKYYADGLLYHSEKVMKGDVPRPPKPKKPRKNKKMAKPTWRNSNNSWNTGSYDTVVADSIVEADGVHRFLYIPALSYWWEELPGGAQPLKPLVTDRDNRTVLVKDSTFMQGGVFCEVKTILYKSRENKAREAPHTFFFQSHNNLLKTALDYITRPSYAMRGRPYRINTPLPSLEGVIESERMYERGLPMEGKLLVAGNKKFIASNSFKTKHTLHETDARLIRLNSYSNGLKHGTCETVFLERKNKISDNLEQSFLLDPRPGESYHVVNYNNGVRHGKEKLMSVAEELKVLYNKDSSDGSIKKIVYAFPLLDINYSNGVTEGPFLYSHSNGKKAVAGAFKEGRLHGRLELFEKNGMCAAIANYDNDIANGPFTEFSEGRRYMEGYFNEGIPGGKFIMYNTDNGRPLVEMDVKNSYIETKRIYFDPPEGDTSSRGALKEALAFSEGSFVPFTERWWGTESFLSLSEAWKYKKVPAEFAVNAQYSAYFENGKTLCAGMLKDGLPAGIWKFYNVAGTLINEVVFEDNRTSITGYFNNGKLRCKGTVKNWSSGYDCSTHQDKTLFEISYTDAWNYSGEQILKDGTGKGVFQDENGSRLIAGEMSNYRENGIWKYYDPNGKLNATGKFVNGHKEGLWFYGDLENLNFEDAACFDPNDSLAQHKFRYNQKVVNLTTELYVNGQLRQTYHFNSDLNKEQEYRPKRRRTGRSIRF